MTTLQKYIEDVLKSFENDPADTPFQRGYEAAFLDIKEAMELPSIRFSREFLREGN